MPKNNSFEGFRSRERNNNPRKPKILQKLFKKRDIEPRKKEEMARQTKKEREEATRSLDRRSDDFSFGPDRPKRDKGDFLSKFLNSFQKIGGGNAGIVNAAQEYEGVRYDRGGQGKDGIDCSGLVVEAMRDAGYNIPDMTAAEMKRRTPEIDISQARRGDLLLWADGGHVEIVQDILSDGRVLTIGSVGGRGVGEHTYSLRGKALHRNTLNNLA